MRFFHLSDLHIGKQLYGYSLLEDQEWMLNKIYELIDKERPDGILIAGDVYDKSVPAAEAVTVFDRFLTKVSQLEPKIPVLIISGNHDSPERLSFGAEILSRRCGRRLSTDRKRTSEKSDVSGCVGRDGCLDAAVCKAGICTEADGGEQKKSGSDRWSGAGK